MNWFAGVYREPKNFFPQFAVEPCRISQCIPFPNEGRRAAALSCATAKARSSAASSRRISAGKSATSSRSRTGFPGNWEFVVRAIYDAGEAKTDTSLFFFHWQYLNESVKRRYPARANQVGIFLVEVEDVDRAAAVSEDIDKQFRNSIAETLTETEQAFQIGFVKQTEAIVIAVRIVSFVVIFIILAVMANTMAMTARERLGESATLKALGFSPAYVGGADLRGIARDRRPRLRDRRRPHVPRGRLVRGADGHALSGIRSER